jgi:prepilin-type processing-associated H-X9-DG protein
LAPYLPNRKIWVCPKKSRGLTYATQPGVFDPSITGFISYGFNYLGLFGGSADEPLVFKANGIVNPSKLVAIDECNGANNPAEIGGDGNSDAAWHDDLWAATSYPNSTSILPANSRFQSQFGKHNKRINILYADGHASVSKPSQLFWGQYYDMFQDNRLGSPITPDGFKNWNQTVADPTLDAAEYLPP